MTRSIEEQVDLLMLGTEYGDSELARHMAEELRERLETAQAEGRPLRVYCGFDPRTSDLHIGHTVPIRKLRQFQELGHHVIFLVGTYTSTIGDPSDKDRLREVMSRQQAVENGRTYAEQACRILDPEATEVLYNHQWLEGLSFAEIIDMASLFSVQQFLSRDAFRKRWEAGDAVYLHETFYSLMQAHDACVLRADVQVGGTDQLFNIVTASRRLMTARGLAPNVAVIMGILPGTDGRVKMSKSLGNHIPLLSEPADMYGKVMSTPDEAMGAYFSMATRFDPREISERLESVETGRTHPRDAKMGLAREIVEIFYGPDVAMSAEEEFERVHRSGQLPTEIKEVRLGRAVPVLDALVSLGLAGSRSAGRRLIDQGGVRLDGVVVSDPELSVRRGVLQAGKRRFVRLT